MDKKRILVVEDQGLLALDICTRLSALGHDPIESVRRGEDAIKQALILEPDIILMDIQLEGEIDGVSAAETIQKSKNIPIIYLTAHSDAHTLDRAKKTTPYGYLLKPFEEQELNAAIETAIYKYEMEQKVRESEQKYTAFMNSFEGIVYQTKLDSGPVFINGLVEKITGYTEAEMFEKEHSFEKLIYPPDLQVITEGGRLLDPQYSFEYRIVKKDGSLHWVSCTSQILNDEHGNPEKVQGIIQDIQEKKELEEHLVRSQRLDSIGVLAGGIAHDFNNMLMGSLANIELALVETNEQSPSYNALETAQKVLLGARKLAGQLLVFSKGGQPHLESINLKTVLQDHARFILRGAKTRAVLHLGEDLNEVEFDKSQLTQIIQNLLLNASEAMPEGGEIDIVAKNIENDKVRVEIIDHGQGISAIDLPKIFDPFFTTKDKGSGLGLSVTYAIVNKHNADISVRSEEGVGTVFTLTMQASKKTVQPEKKDINPEKGFGSNTRV